MNDQFREVGTIDNTHRFICPIRPMYVFLFESVLDNRPNKFLHLRAKAMDSSDDL
jgi:hypothetical protein